MKAIYEPTGAAREYAPLAVNLYSGCTHGCRYCYVPGILRMAREDFHRRVMPRDGVLGQLQRDAKRLCREGRRNRVHLCFTCDPYPLHDFVATTNNALAILRFAGFPVSILTKAGLHAARDFYVLRSMDAEFGVSLAWADDTKRAAWEPGAAPVIERVKSLQLAKHVGIATWASVEPVIEPAEALAAIRLLIPVADVIKVGRWNHDKAANAIDWRAFAREAKALLEGAGVRYVLKRGLAELVEESGR